MAVQKFWQLMIIPRWDHQFPYMGPAPVKDGGKQLKAKLKAATQRAKAQELEIQQLRSRINALASGSAAQSQPQLEASSRRCMTPPTPSYIDVDDFEPESSLLTTKPPKLPALNLFPGLPPMDRFDEPRSDFDYQMALHSDIMDTAFHRIALDFDPEDRPLYAVNGDDEILASDPYPC
ncbi:hypothetical protein B0H13DRAFT_2339928 [Mycena leptocephala]|nr:hypothetical protein B0H13DRAFT_2339928 [Mycena leptocephala]